ERRLPGGNGRESCPTRQPSHHGLPARSHRCRLPCAVAGEGVPEPVDAWMSLLTLPAYG
ncbi:unnamed protein product, partial [Ectocarpus sp. 8 AP-2014]